MIKEITGAILTLLLFRIYLELQLINSATALLRDIQPDIKTVWGWSSLHNVPRS